MIGPELGVSVVDVGLLWGRAYGDGGSVLVYTTASTAACPLADAGEDQQGHRHAALSWAAVVLVLGASHAQQFERGR
ncbi:hypothetical protein R0J90_23945, partial [Micrococcus sp. SIMBA_144]